MGTERIKIREKADLCCYGSLDGPIDRIIKTLQHIKEKGWEGIDYDYYQGEREYYVYRTRLETDDEYKVRIERENQQKEYRRMQYEDLKKEFG
jgi:hypothetical protein